MKAANPTFGEYLPRATNFDNMTKKKKTNPLLPSPNTECPLCYGYGGWNIALNTYGPGQHTEAHCSQCNGYGYVEAESVDANCVHIWKEISREEAARKGIEHPGECHHLCACANCGKTTAYDSSD